ncbi:MAG: KpsF/GutQ family sugar-phosphate isomerase [Edaphocola sp.]
MLTIPQQITQYAGEAISNELSALQALQQYIDNNFIAAVQLMHQAKGRMVVTGVGKSAIVAQKITATFNSTGTPALFMHAADAIHGDLGMIQPDDVVIVLSKSGDSPEIKALVPFIKNFGNKVVAICGKSDSYLATQAHYFINTTIDKEACPYNLAPTTSTTAQMMMGDAVAITLLQLRGFTDRDFARFHPGGHLGKRLYLKVQDLSSRNAKPVVAANANLRQVIVEISGKMLGATAVLDNLSLLGIITDGDLRRMLERGGDTSELTAKDICSFHPKTVEADALAIHALDLMRQYDITQLIVTNNGSYAGMIHLHDLLREGLL